jgi:DNA replication and repair protein RecF
MKLIQCEIYREFHGHPPIVLFDDMASELDDRAQDFILSHLRKIGAQVFLTSINEMTVEQSHIDQRFHVEQGNVGKMI